MATYIFDLDGTVLKYHKNEWVENAKETLLRLAGEGHDIMFITMRCIERDSDTEWSPENTDAFLEREGMGNYLVLYNRASPRILVDDWTPQAISKKIDARLDL